MPEPHGDTLRVYVRPGASQHESPEAETGTCTVRCPRPWRTWGGSTPKRPTRADLGDNPRRLEIAWIKDAPSTRRVRKPRYLFYYDTHLADEEGRGTEIDPWPDLGSALSGIAKLHEVGRIPLRRATRLR